MKEAHQELINQHKKNKKAVKKSDIKALVLQVLMMSVVLYMKSSQETASLSANIISTSLVTVILCWHFLDFYPRRNRHKNVADTVLEGVNLENQSPFLKPQFFKVYLKEFSTFSSVINMAIFDFILIYFFSVSYTQLLKALNPEALLKLKFITPLSTWGIVFSIGWAYYKAIEPLSVFKRKAEV